MPAGDCHSLVAGAAVSAPALAASSCRSALRLKRIFPAAQYRATSGIVQLPLPRTGGVGSDRVRDVELLQYIADFLLAMDGKAQGSVDVRVAAGVSA